MMRFVRHCLRVLLAIIAGLALLGFLALTGCAAGKIARDALHDGDVR